MKCILMNKNTEVLVAEYVDNLGVFTEIYEVRCLDYAPLIIKDKYNENTDINVELSDWFKGRGIPAHRDCLEMLLARLNITMTEELLNKSFGLSLSDQYWLKPYNSNIEYKDINFFDHDFDSIEFTEATFSDKGNAKGEISLKTPNNTTDGMLRKSWVIKNGKRYLLKSGYMNEPLPPFNETLASMICERLGFDHVTYTLDIVKNKVVSVCECFINTNTEYVPAYQVIRKYGKNYEDKDYNNYIKELEKNGIENAKDKIDNMFILDYLMLNNDRHLNNFGIIRDVNTLKWLDVAPIFDTGQSLSISSYDDREIIVESQGKFFYNIERFENMIKTIDNVKRVDISKLDGVVKEFDDVLHKYQHITNFSDSRIHKLCVLLNMRINKLKEIIES